MSGAHPSTLDMLRQALAALELKWTQDTFHTDSRGDVTGCAIDAVRAQIERMTPSPELLEAVRQASAKGLPFAEHDGEVVFINRGDQDQQHAEHEANACPYCGGSGHKDDAKVPAGWVLVPECPYEAQPMIAAFMRAELVPGGHESDCYRALIAARPKPGAAG